jgi:antigen 43
VLVVLSGGTALGTTIDGGGSEIVSAGGSDGGAQVAGGEQDVFGTASGVTVFTGSQVVESSGRASNTSRTAARSTSGAAASPTRR